MFLNFYFWSILGVVVGNLHQLGFIYLDYNESIKREGFTSRVSSVFKNKFSDGGITADFYPVSAGEIAVRTQNIDSMKELLKGILRNFDSSLIDLYVEFLCIYICVCIV